MKHTHLTPLHFLLTLCLTLTSFSSVLASPATDSATGSSTDNHDEHGHAENEEEHSDSTTISDYFIQASGIQSAVAGPQTIIRTDTLFGVISPVQDQVFNLHASYPSLVKKVLVQVGDQVKKGQVLAQLTNIQTLQTYSLKSPANGEVTARSVNTGDRVDAESILQVSDLSSVWVNLSAFPENIERLKKGQNVSIYDLHDHENSPGKISYIAPLMSGGHIARARAIIDNSEGHWRPGMHVKGDVEISKRQVPMAVNINALQTFEEKTVVFTRHDNTFEVAPIVVGEKGKNWVEVVSGLPLNSEYVSENSFLIKADILKSGASHAH